MTFSRNILAVGSLVLLCTASQTAWAQFGDLFGARSKVPTITIDELKLMLNERSKVQREALAEGSQPSEQKFVLVDVRSDAEVNVSVIPGAITKQEFEKNRQQFQGQLVIPYCTVGGRSSRYAAELEKAGAQVKNFEGSILEWVQTGMPVVTLAGKPTNRVHIYSDRYKIPPKYEAVTK